MRSKSNFADIVSGGWKLRATRPRSVPSPWPFGLASLCWLLNCLLGIGGVVALVTVIIQPGKPGPWIWAGASGLAGVLYVAAWCQRRAARCPLCRGTPLLDSGATPHPRASRIGPLNHGLSAMVTILATRKFRCMYCGSVYDLTRRRRAAVEVRLGVEDSQDA